MSEFNNAQKLYQNMSRGSRDYFATMMVFSAQNPERMQKVLRYPRTPTNHMLTNDVVLYNSIHNLQHEGTPKERALTNQFFANNNVVQAMHHGLGDRFERTNFKDVHIKGLRQPSVSSVSKVQAPNAINRVSQPQLYQRRLHQGVNLLNNLSPAGQRYFLNNVKAANKDLKHYNHLEYSNPSSLTQKELNERNRLNNINASGQTPMRTNKAQSLQHMSPEEQSIINNFMKDDVTQDTLNNHDMYDNVYQMNKRNRILAENRSEDAKDIDPFGRTNSVQLGNHTQSDMVWDKEHHVGFKVGSLVAVSAYHHISSRDKDKRRNWAVLNDGHRTKQLTTAFKRHIFKAPIHTNTRKRHVHQEGPTMQ